MSANFIVVHTAQVAGLGGAHLRVEIKRTDHEGAFRLVLLGLSKAMERELRVRITCALESWGSGPADGLTAYCEIRPGHRACLDLAIAVGFLALISNDLSHDMVESTMFYGEFGLDGSVRPARASVTAAAIAESIAMPLVVAKSQASACAMVAWNVYGIDRFSQLGLLEANELRLATKAPLPERDDAMATEMLSAVGAALSDDSLRLLQVAAVGRIPLLLLGPVGVGKTMYARRLPYLLPAMSPEQTMQMLRVYDAAGLTIDRWGPPAERPFRAPHHTISFAAMIGGGATFPRAGEVSLAHNGVLFLDELQEFTLSTFQQAFSVSQAGSVKVGKPVVEFPADAWLVGSALLCPYRGHFPRSSCRCQGERITRSALRLEKFARYFPLRMRIPDITLDTLRSRGRSDRLLNLREPIATAHAFVASNRNRREIVMPNEREQIGNAGLSVDHTWRVARAIADANHHQDVYQKDLDEAIHLTALNLKAHKERA